MEEPLSTPPEVLNALETLISPEFASEVQKAEEEIARAIERGDDLDEVIDVIEEDLSEALGPDFDDTEAVISGLLYVTDDKDVPTGEVALVENLEGTFLKPKVVMFGSMPKIVLMFEMPGEADDEGLPSLETAYYAETTGLTKFELYPEEEKTLEETLQEHTDRSREATSDPDFLEASLDDQLEYFEEIQDVIEEELGLKYGTKIEFEADKFVVRFDDMPLRFSDSVTDQSKLDVEERFRPRGTYQGVRFIEREERDKPFKGGVDFPLTGGVPCIVVRDDRGFREEGHGVTYHIPIDKVRSHNLVA